MDEHALQQQAEAKEADIRTLEKDRADFVRRHEVNVASYQQQIESLQRRIDEEGELIRRDVADIDAKIDRLRTEINDYRQQAAAAHEQQERQRLQRAAIIAAGIANENK